jgi:hypothetical protein
MNILLTILFRRLTGQPESLPADLYVHSTAAEKKLEGDVWSAATIEAGKEFGKETDKERDEVTGKKKRLRGRQDD